MRKVESDGSDSQLLCRYQKERESKYELPLDDRDKAFHELNLEYFSTLGYASLLFEMLQDFSLFAENLDLVSFVKASKRVEEGADLFVQQDDVGDSIKTMFFKLMPEQFQHLKSLKMLLRREFLHVHDMLDPGFCYAPSLKTGNSVEMAERNLLQDRYRLLWHIYVNVRLSEKFVDYESWELLPQMRRVFPGLTQGEYSNMENNFKTRKWTHLELLSLAEKGIVDAISVF